MWKEGNILKQIDIFLKAIFLYFYINKIIFVFLLYTFFFLKIKLAKTLLPIFEGNEKAIKDIKRDDEALISFNDLVAVRCLLPAKMMFFHFDRPYIYNQTKSFRKTDTENYVKIYFNTFILF